MMGPGRRQHVKTRYQFGMKCKMEEESLNRRETNALALNPFEAQMKNLPASTENVSSAKQYPEVEG